MGCEEFVTDGDYDNYVEREEAVKRQAEFEEFLKTCPKGLVEKNTDMSVDIGWEISCVVRDPANPLAWAVLYNWGDCESEFEVPEEGCVDYKFPFTKQGVLWAIKHMISEANEIINHFEDKKWEWLVTKARQTRSALQEWRKRIEDGDWE